MALQTGILIAFIVSNLGTLAGILLFPKYFISTPTYQFFTNNWLLSFMVGNTFIYIYGAILSMILWSYIYALSVYIIWKHKDDPNSYNIGLGKWHPYRIFGLVYGSYQQLSVIINFGISYGKMQSFDKKCINLDNDLSRIKFDDIKGTLLESIIINKEWKSKYSHSQRVMENNAKFINDNIYSHYITHKPSIVCQNAQLKQNEMIILRNVHYSDNTLIDLMANIYLPLQMNDAKPTPVIIFFVGGAWEGCDATFASSIASSFVKHNISFVYPIIPVYPNTVDDMLSAMEAIIQFTIKHASIFNVDPNEIILIGQSSGGHLLSLLITNLIQKKSDLLDNISLLSFLCAPFDITEHYDWESKRKIESLSVMGRLFGGKNNWHKYSPTQIIRDWNIKTQLNKDNNKTGNHSKKKKTNTKAFVYPKISNQQLLNLAKILEDNNGKFFNSKEYLGLIPNNPNWINADLKLLTKKCSLKQHNALIDGFTIPDTDHKYSKMIQDSINTFKKWRKWENGKDWELKSDVKGFKSYTKSIDGQAIPIVKGEKILKIKTPIILGTILNPNNTLKWDKNVDEIKLLEGISQFSQIVYVSIKTPTRFIYDREMVNLGYAYSFPDGSFIFGSFSIPYDKCPPNKDKVRANCKTMVWHVRPMYEDNINYSYVTYYAQLDLGGNLPAWITNGAAKDMPLTIVKVQKYIENNMGSIHKPGILNIPPWPFLKMLSIDIGMFDVEFDDNITLNGDIKSNSDVDDDDEDMDDEDIKYDNDMENYTHLWPSNTLIIHCKHDKVVPISSSIQFHKELNKLGVNNELRIYNEGNHYDSLFGLGDTNNVLFSQLNLDIMTYYYASVINKNSVPVSLYKNKGNNKKK